VKHWQETRQIVDHIVRLARDGRRAALATVTRIAGSAYRRPGAKLLIEDGGALHGGVSGGCLEEDVRQIGLQVLQTGRTRLRHYATGEDEDKIWGLGLGCNGQVDVLVQPVVPAADVWTRVRDLLGGDAPFVLASPLEDDGAGGVTVVGESGRLAGAADNAIETAAHDALLARRSGWARAGERTVFAEVLTPPPRLLVCGAGEDARPLVALAAAAGFRVFVADHRAAYLTAARFPDARGLLSLRPTDDAALPEGFETFAVVMTHSLDRDSAWVRRLLRTQAPYIGLLGPRARTQRIVEGLDGAERVFGPVGLDLGADGPEQVAISIVAELLSVWSGHEPRHLRERETAVHAER
jgi:xanthine/CO dehydrogenase XdhC/CoxF family maturation factor